MDFKKPKESSVARTPEAPRAAVERKESLVPTEEKPRTAAGENPEKGYVQTVALSTIFGYFGVDRFYLDKVGTGILKLLTFGGLGIWVLVDAIIAIAGAARQKGFDEPLYDTNKYRPFFTKLLLVWAALYIAFAVTSVLFWAVVTPRVIDQVKKQTVCATIDGTKQCKTVQQWIDTSQELKQDKTLQQLQANPDVQQFLQSHPELQQSLQAN